MHGHTDQLTKHLRFGRSDWVARADAQLDWRRAQAARRKLLMQGNDPVTEQSEFSYCGQHVALHAARRRRHIVERIKRDWKIQLFVTAQSDFSYCGRHSTEPGEVQCLLSTCVYPMSGEGYNLRGSDRSAGCKR
jgi:hypothetical protein